MTTLEKLPTFIVGNRHKAFRVQIKDRNDAPVIIAAGSTVKLFAIGFSTGHLATDEPGEEEWGGVEGTIEDQEASPGWVSFSGLGQWLSVGGVGQRRKELYTYRIRYRPTGTLIDAESDRRHLVAEEF